MIYVYTWKYLVIILKKKKKVRMFQLIAVWDLPPAANLLLLASYNYNIFVYILLWPAKIDTSHLIKSQVKWSIKFFQSFNRFLIYVRMITSFGFPKTMRSWATFRFHQARKTFCWIKIKMLFCDNSLQS